MKHSMQISESIGLGTILALSGGFMDAYSILNVEKSLPMLRREICSFLV